MKILSSLSKLLSLALNESCALTINLLRGVCTQAPVFCIVMEFCPYGPLNQIITEGAKVITTSRVVSWSKQIAVGMQYLHMHKIIHRDLKSPK